MIEKTVTTVLKCPLCSSEALAKFGTYNGKQLYWCKACQKKVKVDGTAPNMKTPSREVSSALSMYYEGMSIAAIRRQLEQEYDHAPSTATIYEWIQKYTQYAIDSAKGYHPSVGSVWVADETVLKLDGQNVWFWDIIDEKTRFLLASRISISRTGKDAQILMDRAFQTAGKRPSVVITDKLASYLDVAYGEGTEHRQGSPFNIENNSNLIERFHGTLKARTKVMRGLKNIETAHDFTQGWLVHYNYLRPHESLHESTPAQLAGINYPYKNWDEISTKHRPSVKVTVTHVKRGTMKLRDTHIGRPKRIRRKAKQSPTVLSLKGIR